MGRCQSSIQQVPFPLGWPSWLKRRGGMQRETPHGCKEKCYSFRSGLIWKQSPSWQADPAEGRANRKRWCPSVREASAAERLGDQGFEWVPGSTCKWLWAGTWLPRTPSSLLLPFLLWQNIHKIKFTTLTTLSVHSQSSATLTII